MIFLYTMLAIMLLAFITTVIVDRSKLGFGLRCIQQNEDAADMLGINVMLYKNIAFILSSVFLWDYWSGLRLLGSLHFPP